MSTVSLTFSAVHMLHLQLKVSEQQERLTTLQLSEAETRRQLDIALAELSSTRSSAAGAESAASEAAGLRRALAEAERQMNGAGAELSELSRQLAEAKGQRDASQVGACIESLSALLLFVPQTLRGVC
jgi:chromosome segregation ATPase